MDVSFLITERPFMGSMSYVSVYSFNRYPLTAYLYTCTDSLIKLQIHGNSAIFTSSLLNKILTHINIGDVKFFKEK